jgi:hypothetical protein
MLQNDGNFVLYTSTFSAAWACSHASPYCIYDRNLNEDQEELRACPAAKTTMKHSK